MSKIDDTPDPWQSMQSSRLTYEALVRAVERLRNWKPPESWSEFCPKCSVDGHDKRCKVCNGVGFVCVSRKSAPAE